MKLERFSRWVLIVALVLIAQRAGAEPLDEKSVPAELRPWMGWVLDEVGDEACTIAAAEHQCVWLGEVVVNATDTGATFSLTVVTERRTEVPLPGSARFWPEDVRVSAEPRVVLEQGG